MQAAAYESVCLHISLLGTCTRTGSPVGYESLYMCVSLCRNMYKDWESSWL